jgi:hypothetical protein
MKKTRLARPSFPALLALAAAAPALALTPTEWQHRQALAVPAAGLVRVDLSAASFDAAAPQLEDVRIIDPAGREQALLIDRPQPPAAEVAGVASFDARVSGAKTQITAATGTRNPLRSIVLETPSRYFLKAVMIEVSDDGSSWTVLERGVPIFREGGAEKLDLPLGGRSAATVRLTLDDDRTAPVPFTAARLLLEPGPAPEPVPVGAHIAARDEFAEETVLTVALDGQHQHLTSLAFETADPLFMRRVTVGVRQAHDGLPDERIIASGAIFRVSVDGAPARSQMEVPLAFIPSTRELLVHIHNGDSPPLGISAVLLKRLPVSLLFVAPAPGAYTLLLGNPQAGPAHYDLAALAGDLQGARATTVVAGGLEDTPGYAPRTDLSAPSLPDVPLTGAPLDTAEWTSRRAVELTGTAVQELELDADALARCNAFFTDLRLMQNGNQIPYVLERSGLSRALELSPEPAPDAKRPSVSRWSMRLPRPGLPLRSVVLTSSTSLFQRMIRLYETVPAPQGGSYERTLASGLWVRRPEIGFPDTLVLGMPERMSTETLWIETDNGDNPPIALGTVRCNTPVVRLIFKVAEPDGVTLVYGNPSAAAPRYDLSLVAGRLLTASRTEAHLGAPEAGGSSGNPFSALKGGLVFWGALVLVVAGLLLVVAKLLPKPKV